MVDKDEDLQELLESVPPEERAAAWEQYVRDEVNALLDTFLPESISGNVGVKYDYPVIRVSPKTGKAQIDKNKATGALISIMFDFAAPIEFFGEAKPKKAE